MGVPLGQLLSVSSAAAFRSWLQRNHAAKAEVWLVQYKKASGKHSINYSEAVAEAICFGWIDSSIRKIDDERYATRFTPRRPGSNWTAANLSLARKLEAQGRMTQAGRKALPSAS